MGRSLSVFARALRGAQSLVNRSTLGAPAPAAVAASRGGPLETVRLAMTAGRPSGSPAAPVPAPSRAEAQRIVERIFDSAAIAEACLGPHWLERTAAERAELARLLGGLAARAYGSRLAGAERQMFTGEAIEGPAARVRGHLLAGGRPRGEIEYRLRRARGRWRVHDFVVGEVSFVKSYGAHLRDVVESSSFEDLLWKLRLKAVQDGASSHRGG